MLWVRGWSFSRPLRFVTLGVGSQILFMKGYIPWQGKFLECEVQSSSSGAQLLQRLGGGVIVPLEYIEYGNA